MEIQLTDLNRSIDHYRSLQDRHIAAFDTELMPDLSTLTFERAAAFADLKNNLDQFLNILHDETQLSLALFYQDQLKLIMEIDQRLRERVQTHKDSLARHMKQARAGKTAIRGYATSARMGRPKALGFKG